MIDMRELYWAAGFIEGEGYFGSPIAHKGTGHSAPRIIVAQKDIQPLNRLSCVFGVAGKYKTKSGVTNWTLYGNKAIGVMMTLWPLMSDRRRIQIERVIASWKQNRSCKERAAMVKRDKLGRLVRGCG